LPEIPVAEAAITRVFAAPTSAEASLAYWLASVAALATAALAVATCPEFATA
jgi:hypothetical protein